MIVAWPPLIRRHVRRCRQIPPVSDIKPCLQRGLAAIRALITVSGPGRVPTRQVSGSTVPDGASLSIPSPPRMHRAGSALCSMAPKKPLGLCVEMLPLPWEGSWAPFGRGGREPRTPRCPVCLQGPCRIPQHGQAATARAPHPGTDSHRAAGQEMRQPLGEDAVRVMWS